MAEKTRGLPLTSSRAEQAFPTLTPSQIGRIAAHGRSRSVQTGEVLFEQGDSRISFFVVVSGELEVIRPSRLEETVVAVFGPGQFTGEVNTLSHRPALLQARVTKPGELVSGSPLLLVLMLLF